MENVGVTEGQELPSRLNFWIDRPVLVTGATGFVGSWLVMELLKAGAAAVCLVRDWAPQSIFWREKLEEHARVVRGDVCDQSLVERVLGEYEVDTVIHLAAQTIVGIANRNPVSTFESNVRGTWTLLEACRRSPAVRQIVLASSDKAYGEQEVLPYDESMPLRGQHPYDVSKSCADLIGAAYATTYELPVGITRCGNFYGGGDLNWNRVVPGTIRSVLRGQRPVIRSDGASVRDYFYVEDGVAGYMLLAQRLAEDRSLRGKAFNFSNETPMTVIEVVRRILARMGSDLEPDVRNEACGEIRSQHLCARLARETLGWQPLFDFDAGLDRAITWYREFLSSD